MRPQSIDTGGVRLDHLLYLHTLKNKMHSLLSIAVIARLSLGVFTATHRGRIVLLYEELDHGFEIT